MSVSWANSGVEETRFDCATFQWIQHSGYVNKPTNKQILSCLCKWFLGHYHFVLSIKFEEWIANAKCKTPQSLNRGSKNSEGLPVPLVWWCTATIKCKEFWGDIYAQGKNKMGQITDFHTSLPWLWLFLHCFIQSRAREVFNPQT